MFDIFCCQFEREMDINEHWSSRFEDHLLPSQTAKLNLHLCRCIQNAFKITFALLKIASTSAGNVSLERAV
jgi:hypothetical protein